MRAESVRDRSWLAKKFLRRKRKKIFYMYGAASMIDSVAEMECLEVWSVLSDVLFVSVERGTCMSVAAREVTESQEAPLPSLHLQLQLNFRPETSGPTAFTC
ncbi:unnamed protein product [Cercospora beticola]|nr:unnamed protein product [Cercospora beticola]